MIPEFIVLVILFWVLSPGNFITLPENGDKQTVALVHAIIFAIIFMIIIKLGFNLCNF